MRYTKVLLAGILALLAIPAFSQSSPAPVVGQRKENQQDRIANGVQSGQLTAGETKNLEKKEAGLNAEENRMEKRDNGNLTARDKARLNRQQNRLSGQIYRDKHNARVQNTDPKTEVGQRQRNQQERIAQGIQSGQVTAGEASHLEGREAAVNHEIRSDRAANGGKLTAKEKAQINRQQNASSGAIYRKKHNGRTQ
jgi:Tfp pilus assembly protein FimT